MCEIVPSIAVPAVIFSNRAPLAFTHVRPPFSPWHTLDARFLKAYCFCTVMHDCCLPPGSFTTPDHARNSSRLTPAEALDPPSQVFSCIELSSSYKKQETVNIY